MTEQFYVDSISVVVSYPPRLGVLSKFAADLSNTVVMIRIVWQISFIRTAHMPYHAD